MELRFNNGSSVSLPSMKKLHFKPRLQSLVDSSQRNPLEFNAHEFTMNSFLGIRGSVANPRKYSPNNNSVLQFNDKVRIYIEKGNHLSVSGVTHNTQYRLKVDCDSPYSVDDFDNLLIAFKNTETNEKRFFKYYILAI